ncbi:MAG: hypothetical protein J6B23_07955 [Clostridia bacterium]|nr:hypothetical protein [Clostridia bacterium]
MQVYDALEVALSNIILGRESNDSLCAKTAETIVESAVLYYNYGIAKTKIS